MNDPLILIADDNEPTRQLMAGILGSSGYSTMQAIDGGTALKVMQDHTVACAFIDQYMEPMGGLQMARYMKDNEITPPPMVLVTAHETTDLLTQSNELGFIQVLKKPVAPNRLLMTVERLMNI